MQMQEASSSLKLTGSAAVQTQNSNTISPEQKVFGVGLFGSYPTAGSAVDTGRLSCHLILCAFAIVVSSAIVFLLGTNIFIQWRTMFLGGKKHTLRKIGYIILSILAILAILYANTIIFKRLKTSSARKARRNLGNYQIIDSADHGFEMDDL